MEKDKSLDGIPWHTEFLKMADGDTRRDKRRCVFLSDSVCVKRGADCIGSSRCLAYKEKNMRLDPSDKELIEKYSKMIAHRRNPSNNDSAWQRQEIRVVHLGNASSVHHSVTVHDPIQYGDIITIKPVKKGNVIKIQTRHGDNSEAAQISRECIGHKKGQTFEHNGQIYIIINVEHSAEMPKHADTQKPTHRQLPESADHNTALCPSCFYYRESKCKISHENCDRQGCSFYKSR